MQEFALSGMLPLPIACHRFNTYGHMLHNICIGQTK